MGGQLVQESKIYIICYRLNRLRTAREAPTIDSNIFKRYTGVVNVPTNNPVLCGIEPVFEDVPDTCECGFRGESMTSLDYCQS